MKRQNSLFPFLAVGLCQATYGGLTQATVAYTAREAFCAAALSGLATAGALLALRLVDGQQLTESDTMSSRLARLVLTAALVLAAVETAGMLAAVYTRQYPSGTGWALLLAAAVLVLAPAAGAMDRVACAVLALAAAGGVLLVLGLAGQMQLRQISTAPLRLPAIWAAARAMTCFCPEYLTLPVAAARRRWWLLPLWTGLVQAAAALCTELVFGFDGGEGGYGAGMLLQVWDMGIFSRLDALWVWLWLTLALLRLLVIGGLLRRIWPGKTERRVYVHDAG